MRRIFASTGMISAAAIAALALSGAASAQQAPGALDVAGVSLGMTVDQARAALQQFDPNIRIVPIYGYWADGVVDQKALIENDPSSPDKLTTVTGLFGVSLHHAYANDGHEITGGASDPVVRVSGDWFILKFTPNTSGGSLYAMARTVRYAPAEETGGATPTVDSLLQQLQQKYGKPSSGDNGETYWMYDARGRMLSASSRDFRRCQISASAGQEYAIHGQLMAGTMSQYDISEYTLKDLGEALTETDGASMDQKAEFRASDLFMNLVGFLPDVDNLTRGQDPAVYRQCGTEMNVSWGQVGGHLDNFTTFLVNVDHAYFNNGLAAYFAPGQSAAPVAAPKL